MKTILLNDDPNPDEDNDNENTEEEGKTCSSTHKCNNASVTGQCILKDGHEGAHFCGWCASQF